MIQGTFGQSYPHKKRSLKFILICAVYIVAAGFVVWGLVALWHGRGANAPKTASTAIDTTPPTITLDNTPFAAGTDLNGTVTVTVVTHDNVGIKNVTYTIDDIFFAITYAAPFSLQLDTAKLTAGEHTLVATAYDAAKNKTSTHKIKFTVASAVANNSATTTDTTTKTSSNKVATTSSSSSSSSSSSGSNPTPPAAVDTESPTKPSSLLLAASDPYTVNVTWTASTDNVAVSSYHILRDGTDIGSSVDVSYTDYTVVPGNTYTYEVVAFDAAGNSATSATAPIITLATTSIWMGLDMPTNFFDEISTVELGVKFRPLVNGKITGIRFYKIIGDIGSHVGNLWTSGGANLATAAFSGESPEGWQQVSFATPVDVTAGTTYVASFLTSIGKYAATSGYFTSAGITSQYLTALASGVDGNNGLFNNSGSGGFPTGSFGDANYWVDVSFRPNLNAGGPTVTTADPAQIFANFPGANNTGVINKRLPTRDRAPQLAEGATVQDVEIRTPSTITVGVNDVTFKNVKITYTGALNAITNSIDMSSGVTGTVFQDCEIDGQNNVQRAINGLNAATVTRCNIHNTGAAVTVSQNLTVQDSFLHDLFTPSGQSWLSYGVKTAVAASNVTVQRNTIFLTGNETAAVTIQGTGPNTLTNVLVDANLLAGGNYAIAAGAGTNTNVRLTNNKFSTRFFPKVGNTNIYLPTWLTGVTITGNTIYETAAAANTNLP